MYQKILSSYCYTRWVFIKWRIKFFDKLNKFPVLKGGRKKTQVKSCNIMSNIFVTFHFTDYMSIYINGLSTHEPYTSWYFE